MDFSEYLPHKNGGGMVHKRSIVWPEVFVDAGSVVHEGCTILGKRIRITINSSLSHTNIGESCKNVVIETSDISKCTFDTTDMEIVGSELKNCSIFGHNNAIVNSHMILCNMHGFVGIHYCDSLCASSFKDVVLNTCYLINCKFKGKSSENPLTCCTIQLTGGNLYGSETYSLTPPHIMRSDRYVFVIDRNMRITAGCRNFSWKEAKAHWGNPAHHAHEESMLILKTLKKLWKIHYKG